MVSHDAPHVDANPRIADLPNGHVLADCGDGHRFLWLGSDAGDDPGVPTNQFLIEDGDEVALLDAGSLVDFSRVVSLVARLGLLDRLVILFFSHQDPDVCSALPMWQRHTGARVLLPAVWERMMSDMGDFASDVVTGIPDAGGVFHLGECDVMAVPAHFLHSVGQHSLFDPATGILFSGDVGASFPGPGARLFVDDLDPHLPALEPFHRRYMAGNAACRAWVRRVRALPVRMIAPQHGSLLRGRAVDQFLSWMDRLECGTDLGAARWGSAGVTRSTSLSPGGVPGGAQTPARRDTPERDSDPAGPAPALGQTEASDSAGS